MNIAICDDLTRDRDLLAEMVRRYCKIKGYSAELHSFGSGEELLAQYTAGQYQILMLDIYMHELSGIDTARKIRMIDEDCIIILTTTSVDHALDGYAVKAIRYLVKPVVYEAVAEALDKCRDLFRQTMRFIEVPIGKLSMNIPLKDIVFIEVLNHRCFIHTPIKTLQTSLSLTELESMLGGKPFLRCHRSYIINIQQVEEVLEDDFKVKNHQLVPIRKDSKTAVKQEYYDYLFELMRSV